MNLLTRKITSKIAYLKKKEKGIKINESKLKKRQFTFIKNQMKDFFINNIF